ncbi:hypothetical protein A3B39_02180 [Candidatus Daviesbacteria bacterium RIFCSPLOWO2_01_FULL_37_10]|nr:MAG: hypothetical protein A3B39_02180 [Candidatus Daviesbacteria bacterium RIFCSPLOWO2_01_FULL_37_10]
MEKEVLDYLSPDEAETIEYFACDLPPLIKRNPRLKEVDLVIEGGPGTNRTMVHMMRFVFPEALYIGIDASPSHGAGRPWGYKSVDVENIQRILTANELPSLQMERAMIKGSCKDFDLIRDIAQKTGRSVPLFATYEALYSLMHNRELNSYEKKHSDIEVVTIDDLVSFDNPFVAQLHVPCHKELEAKAKQAGWITDKFDIGLLLLRK